MPAGRSTTGTPPVAAATDTGFAPTSPKSLETMYRAVRAQSETLCAPLLPEDCVAQSMAEVSPAKWHLAHTTWFFETFVLPAALADYREYHPRYRFLFNSYYNAVGPQFPRPKRGLLTRPPVEEVYRYRAHVDDHMQDVFAHTDQARLDQRGPIIELGLHHEQQHQELILTDIKHVFSCNPLNPTYRERPDDEPAGVRPMEWLSYPGGIHPVGHSGPGFAYDNEKPQHPVCLQPFELASRLVTNAEYRAFIDDGGYTRPKHWLSDGWNVVRRNDWSAPLYWCRDGAGWSVMTLAGLRPLVDAEPVCHVSFYEADAYARWAGARLALEAEWEVAARPLPVTGNFADSGRLHPAPENGAIDCDAPRQMFGDVWEWTASPYIAYPGYRPAPGAVGEYNAKFMCNQIVLRGGSCVTPGSHVTKSYRNYFEPDARWQFTGIRLARDPT
ncbi:MAG: ergothioneine biosynthesis protein EgtB [Phycisphaerae bacterium]